MAKLQLKVGATSQRVFVFIQDSTATTGVGKTGLTNASSGLKWYTAREDDGNTGGVSISPASATLGTFTSGGFKEKDATNMPGVYELGIPNVALAAGSKFATMMLSGVTGMAPVLLEIELVAYDPFDTVRLGLTALPNVASGSAGAIPTTGTGANQISLSSGQVILQTGTGTGQLDFTSGVVKANATQWLGGTIPAVNVTGVPLIDLKYTLGTISPATAGSVRADAVTGAVGSVTGAVGSVTGAVGSVTGNVGGNVVGSVASVTGNVGGNVTGSVGSVAAAGINRASLAADTGLQSIRSNTLQAGSGTTATLDASASAVDGFYNNCQLYITGGTGVGQSRFITAYVGSTKVATVSAWKTNPDNTSTFAILPFDAVAGATAPTAAQIATAVWQDTTGSDFTTAGSIGKSLFTSGAVPGAAGGIMIAGSNAATTLASLAITGALTIGGGAAITQSSSNADGVSIAGNGTGVGLRITGGATGDAVKFIGGGTSGKGLSITTTSGDGISVLPTAGNGLVITADGASKHGAVITGGTSGTSDGMKLVAGSGGVDLRANQTGNITGTLSTVTTLTNLPAITANWLTAAGINAGALNGKGDWLLASSYVAPSNLTGAQIATAVWTDATAGDFTTANTIGKSIMNGVALGTGLTINGYTGNTPQTGDSFARVGAPVLATISLDIAAIQTTVNAVPTTAAIADKILGRNLAGGSDGGRTVKDAFRAIRNKSSVAGGVLTVTQEDDTTTAWTAAVTSDVAAAPITGIDPT